MKVNILSLDDNGCFTLSFLGIQVPGWNLIHDRYIYLGEKDSKLNRIKALWESDHLGAKLIEIKSSDDNKILEAIKSCKLYTYIFQWK